MWLSFPSQQHRLRPSFCFLKGCFGGVGFGFVSVFLVLGSRLVHFPSWRVWLWTCAVSPRSVPAAGVRRAVMGTNTTPLKTPTGPERCCLWGNLGAAHLCPLRLVARAGRCGVPACGTGCLRAGAFRLAGHRSWGAPPRSQHCLQIRYCFLCSGSRRGGRRRAGSLPSAEDGAASPCSCLLYGRARRCRVFLNLPMVQNIQVFPCWGAKGRGGDAPALSLFPRVEARVVRSGVLVTQAAMGGRRFGRL